MQKNWKNEPQNRLSETVDQSGDRSQSRIYHLGSQWHGDINFDKGALAGGFDRVRAEVEN